MSRKSFNWNAIAEEHDEDNKAEIAYNQMASMEYFHLSDILTHRDKGASVILRILDKQNHCGNGVKAPSPMGEYRLRPFRQYAKPDVPDDEAFKYAPGDKVTWKQQMYNRMPQGPLKGESKKKLTKMEMDAMRKRGELGKIIDIGKAIVDEYGLITVSYQDACQLLCNSGFRYLDYEGDPMAVAICDKEEFTKRQVKHTTDLGKVVLQTRRNWLFQEIPPWEDPAQKTAPPVEMTEDDILNEMIAEEENDIT